MPSKLTPFHAALEMAVTADVHRINQNRRTAKALFTRVKADGYKCAHNPFNADFCNVASGWEKGVNKKNV